MIKKFKTYTNKLYESDFWKYDYPIGTEVIVKKGYEYSKFDGEIGTVIGYHNHYTSVLVKFDKIYYPEWQDHEIQHSGYNGTDPTKHSRYFRADQIEILDNEKYRAMKKKKEELRLKYKDVDPYDEEDWENESRVNESNLTLDDFKVGDKIIYTWKGNRDDEITGHGLKNALHGLTGTVIKNYHSNKLGIQFDKKLDFLHDCHGLGEKLKCYYVIPSAVEHLDPAKEEERRRKKEELRLKYKDIDPYGEEDWEV